MGFLVWEKIPSVIRAVEGPPLSNRALWDNPIKSMANPKNTAKMTALTMDGTMSFRKIDNFSILVSNIHTIMNIIGSKAWYKCEWGISRFFSLSFSSIVSTPFLEINLGYCYSVSRQCCLKRFASNSKSIRISTRKVIARFFNKKWKKIHKWNIYLVSCN